MDLGTQTRRAAVVAVAALSCTATNAASDIEQYAHFRPEQLVAVKGASWHWCRTLDLYAEFSLHLLRGELTKTAAMLDGRRCSEMPKGVRTFKILSVEQRVGTVFVELGPPKEIRESGFWTHAEGLRVVK